MAENPKSPQIPASQMQRGTAPLGKEDRLALVLKIEAEIVRHESAFEEVVGGGRSTRPEKTPQELHALRVKAIKACEDVLAPDAVLREIHDDLAMVEFGPPVYGDQTSSGPKSA